MEIDFMILWKEKVLNKNNILDRITEMLDILFPDTTSENISFVENTDIVHLLPYKISDSTDNTVYLKIECNYSEAESARILSIIRDKVCKGKHKKDFSIICTYDEASLSFCSRLMKPFGIFERRLREVMYLITVKAFGYNWVAKTFPKELLSRIKAKTRGVSDEKLTEIAFEYLDYSEITEYLFEERRWCDTIELIVDSELSDENLDELSKDEIINIIHKTRKESLWRKLFSSNNRLMTLEESVKFFREYRNATMHHHTMDSDTFKMLQSKLRKSNFQLNMAVIEMEQKIYTKEELNSVFSLIGNLTTKIMESIQKLFLSSIGDIIKASQQVTENLALMITKPILPDLTSVFNAVIDPPILQMSLLIDSKYNLSALTDSMRNMTDFSAFFTNYSKSISFSSSIQNLSTLIDDVKFKFDFPSYSTFSLPMNNSKNILDFITMEHTFELPLNNEKIDTSDE